MIQAVWKKTVVAESDRTVVVEGNHYFPPYSIKEVYFEKSNAHTVCPWKGMASYFDIIVDGEVNKRAAWYYPTPSHAASAIKDYVAFWGGVRVRKV
jgi:uncharacterized protein (DUF427 family)